MVTSIGRLLLIVVLTLISGFGDSRGFLYSAKVWQSDKFIFRVALQSVLGFLLGIVAYWFAIKFLQQIGVVSAEMQTLLWFTVTIVGVAIASGQFAHWGLVNQVIGVLVLVGLGLLIFRTGS